MENQLQRQSQCQNRWLPIGAVELFPSKHDKNNDGGGGGHGVHQNWPQQTTLTSLNNHLPISNGKSYEDDGDEFFDNDSFTSDSSDNFINEPFNLDLQ